MLIDTHCHIHEADYEKNITEVFLNCKENGVNKILLVGVNLESSRRALAFFEMHKNNPEAPEIFFSFGIHPHHTHEKQNDMLLFEELCLKQKDNPRLVAIGEIGLDFFYDHADMTIQIQSLRTQLSIAQRIARPVIFHVREAFEDFWPIFDEFCPRGVLHSFTDTKAQVEAAISRDLFFGLNGISLFTRDEVQKKMFAEIPAERILLETDAPFLTPPPFRGKVNEPAYVRLIAEHHATIRASSVKEFARTTSENAVRLFQL